MILTTIYQRGSQIDYFNNVIWSWIFYQDFPRILFFAKKTRYEETLVRYRFTICQCQFRFHISQFIKSSRCYYMSTLDNILKIIYHTWNFLLPTYGGSINSLSRCINVPIFYCTQWSVKPDHLVVHTIQWLIRNVCMSFCYQLY